MHRFKATLHRPEGVGTWTYAPIPPKVSEAFASRGQVRVKGTVDGKPFESTILPTGRGGHYLVLKAEIRKAIGKEAGAAVQVEFEATTRTPKVAQPKELEAALAKDAEARAKFESMPPSHQREYVRFIGEAKKEETRLRRVGKAIAMIKAWKR